MPRRQCRNLIGAIYCCLAMVVMTIGFRLAGSDLSAMIALPANASGLQKDELVEGQVADVDRPEQEINKLPSTVEALDLYCKTPTYALEVLQRFKNLKRLEIGGPDDSFSSASLSVLTKLPMGSLYIRADRLDDGPAVLHQISSLRNLTIISHWDKIRIRQIAKITGIEGLVLHGAISGSLAELKRCSNLTYVQLANRSANGEQCTADDALIHGVSEIPRLEELCICGFELSPVAVDELSQIKNLKSLDVSFTKLTDNDLEAICRISSLEKLNLRGTPITDRGIASLKSLTKLRALDLTGTAISDAAFISVTSLENLEELNVSSTKTNGSGLKHIRGLKKLHALTTSAVVNQNLEPIREFSSLRYLYLHGATVNKTGAHFIAQAPKLESLRVGSFDTPETVAQLNTERPALYIYSEDMSPEVAEIVAKSQTGSHYVFDPMIHDTHDVRDWTCF